MISFLGRPVVSVNPCSAFLTRYLSIEHVTSRHGFRRIIITRELGIRRDLLVDRDLYSRGVCHPDEYIRVLLFSRIRHVRRLIIREIMSPRPGRIFSRPFERTIFIGRCYTATPTDRRRVCNGPSYIFCAMFFWIDNVIIGMRLFVMFGIATIRRINILSRLLKQSRAGF